MTLEWYGYIAAAVAAVGHGSYTAPLKSRAADSVDVHPYVMQTYKVLVCFLTSWLVLLFTDDVFVFSPWGIISGLFWVPGGTCTIFAVRNAGIAISIGIYSALAVLVSYCWGAFIFHESMKDEWVSSSSIFIMLIGLCGMAYSSSQYLSSKNMEDCSHDDISSRDKHVFEVNRIDDDISSLGEKLLPPESVLELQGESAHHSEISPPDLRFKKKSTSILIFGRKFNRRSVGIVCAVYAGVSSGSVLVPMHYSGDKANGLIYVISFAIGALIVLTFGWFLMLLFFVSRARSFSRGIAKLPSLHFQTLWFPGGLAGLLWNVGNVGGIMSVEYLGEGVGYSITQSALIVSGLWGIFWFKEIVGSKYIISWFVGAFVCMVGIILLSYEHSDGVDE